MADKSLSLATDSMQLQTDGITESDGKYSVPVTIAKHMVQDYSGLKVLKPATELEAAVAFMDKIPVTRDHPDSGIVTDRAQVFGYITDPLFENDELRGILQTADKDLVGDIKDKKLTGLSYGFFCNIDKTPGTFGDTAYDAVQTNIFPNHVALLEGDLGRCSLADGCGIHTDSTKNIDSPPANPTDSTKNIDSPPANPTDSTKNIDSPPANPTDSTKNIDSPPVSSTDHAALLSERDSLLKEIDSLKAERDSTPAPIDVLTLKSITAERDSLKADLKAIVETEKDTIIAELTATQDAKTADDLHKLDLAALKTELDMVRELKTDRLSFNKNKATGTNRSRIDSAYADIGRKA